MLLSLRLGGDQVVARGARAVGGGQEGVQHGPQAGAHRGVVAVGVQLAVSLREAERRFDRTPKPWTL